MPFQNGAQYRTRFRIEQLIQSMTLALDLSIRSVILPSARAWLPYARRSKGGLKCGQLLGRQQDAQGTRLAGRPGEQALGFQVQNLLMNSRGRHPKEPLYVRLGRRPPMDLSVVVDEGEVLALLGGVFGSHSESLHGH